MELWRLVKPDWEGSTVVAGLEEAQDEQPRLLLSMSDADDRELTVKLTRREAGRLQEVLRRWLME